MVQRSLDDNVQRLLAECAGERLMLLAPSALFIVALLIWLLQLSLGSTQGSAEMFAAVTGNWMVKLILLGLIWAFLHHFCMGIRILLIDIHEGAAQ